MDMPLPAMAMDMPLPGPLMEDMLLPATVMDMPCPRWIRPLPEPYMTDTLSWIQPLSTVDMLQSRTGFLILWGKT